MNKKILLPAFYIMMMAFVLLTTQAEPRQSGDLQEIRESGVVRVGLRKSTTVYQIDEETGEPDSYVWDLVLAWASEQGVKAEPVFIDSMKDFWTQDGQIPGDLSTNEDINYTPDIFSTIDFAADIFAVVPWRTRLVDMHPYLEVGNVLISRRVDNINHPEDLYGQRIFTYKPQADYTKLINFLNRYKLNYEELPVLTSLTSQDYYEVSLKNPEDQYSEDRVNLQNWTNPDVIKSSSPTAFYNYLLYHQSDVLITNSLTFFIYNMKNSSMRKYLTPTMSITETPLEIGMASPKNKPELSRSLRDFFSSVQTNGVNDALLRKHAGIGLRDYNRLLEMP